MSQTNSESERPLLAKAAAAYYPETLGKPFEATADRVVIHLAKMLDHVGFGDFVIAPRLVTDMRVMQCKIERPILSIGARPLLYKTVAHIDIGEHVRPATDADKGFRPAANMLTAAIAKKRAHLNKSAIGKVTVCEIDRGEDEHEAALASQIMRQLRSSLGYTGQFRL